MRERIIGQLRRLYGGEWRYRDRQWIGPTMTVYSCAALNPRFDGDDDSFQLQYRRRSDGAFLGSEGVIYRPLSESFEARAARPGKKGAGKG